MEKPRTNLFLIFAQVIDNAYRAFRLPGYTHVTSVQNKPVVGIVPKFLRDAFQQLMFHLEHGLSAGNASSV